MTTWILTILFTASIGNAVSIHSESIEYNTESACKTALVEIQKLKPSIPTFNSSYFTSGDVKAVCTAKGDIFKK